MPFAYWLTIHFRKVLTLLLREMKKAVKTLIVFFFFSHKKLSLTGFLTSALKALVNIFQKNNNMVFLLIIYLINNGKKRKCLRLLIVVFNNTLLIITHKTRSFYFLFFSFIYFFPRFGGMSLWPLKYILLDSHVIFVHYTLTALSLSNRR